MSPRARAQRVHSRRRGGAQRSAVRQAACGVCLSPRALTDGVVMPSRWTETDFERGPISKTARSEVRPRPCGVRGRRRARPGRRTGPSGPPPRCRDRRFSATVPASVSPPRRYGRRSLALRSHRRQSSAAGAPADQSVTTPRYVPPTPATPESSKAPLSPCSPPLPRTTTKVPRAFLAASMVPAKTNWNLPARPATVPL